MNMYICMKINYINSPFIKFKAMLLSVFTTSSAMPGCHAEELESLIYGLRFARFYFRAYLFLTSAIEIIICQNPGAIHESMLSDVHIGEKIPPA